METTKMLRKLSESFASSSLECLVNYNTPVATWTCMKSYNDIKIVLMIIPLVFLVRIFLQVKVFSKLTSFSKMDKKTRIKVHDEMWFFLAHLFTFSFGLFAISDQPYAAAVVGNRDTMRTFWLSYPAHHRFLSPHVLLFYVVSAAIWIHNFVDLLLERAFGFRYMCRVSKFFGIRVDERQIEVFPPKHSRTEFVPMLFHHVVTVNLIVMSYYSSFIRIGHTILVTTDVADILLNMAKILFRHKMSLSSNIVFFIFAMAWVYTRVFVFFNILISFTFGSITELVNNCYSWDPIDTYCSSSISNYFICGVCLFILQLLFMYWTTLIIKTIYFSLTSNARDVTDDSESTCSENYSKKLHDIELSAEYQLNASELSESNFTKQTTAKALHK